MSTPWYGEGLRFECSQCGNCCRNHGEYGYVYLMPPEVTALAELLGLDEATFATLGAIAMNAVRIASLGLGDVVAVVGLGLVGQLVAQLARAQGARVQQ